MVRPLQIASQGDVLVVVNRLHQPLVALATKPILKPFPVALVIAKQEVAEHADAQQPHDYAPYDFQRRSLTLRSTLAVVAALEGQLLLVFKRVVLGDAGLHHALGELRHHVECSIRCHRPGSLGHHLAVLEPQLAIEAKAPDAASVRRKRHRRVGRHDSHLSMLRLGRYGLVEKHVANGVGIGIAAHQTRNRVARHISALAADSKPPAEFNHAVVFLHNAAAVGLVLARQSRSPVVGDLKCSASLVAHRQVLHLTRAHVTQADVAFGSLIGDGHLARLRDPRVAVLREHHLDVEVVQSLRLQRQQSRHRKHQSHDSFPHLALKL